MLDELRELYQEVILDHGKNPRNFGRPDGANRQAEGYNPLCGDRLTVYVTLADDGRIAEAAFEGKGCAISVASASLLTEVLKGRTVAEADALFESFHRLCTDDAFDPADAAALEGGLRAPSGALGRQAVPGAGQVRDPCLAYAPRRPARRGANDDGMKQVRSREKTIGWHR
jgi:nitrogen fixation NifU-like protein